MSRKDCCRKYVTVFPAAADFYQNAGGKTIRHGKGFTIFFILNQGYFSYARRAFRQPGVNFSCNYSAASCCCKAPWLFASDIAIVSDQSFAGLCERSGKLSEPPQRQRTKACYANQKAYPACGGEFLPLPHRARSSKDKIASRANSLGPVHLSCSYGIWKTVLNS
ncbi:hypothetical protein LZ24_01370 [Desulfobotulus alkaliphilus]|uniref:Uncharacterized protein n=1 Tax=Desulfobotulus alkaliphilus TaxID=622671 RepID=A0A562RW08_9BACT|nr:hypothetical protein [Desulfobotulus alkaliphilus]TWI73281.1 hypothetical protein LZ24_01370 [Desulfobotulus alkaliphilus]